MQYFLKSISILQEEITEEQIGYEKLLSVVQESANAEVTSSSIRSQQFSTLVSIGSGCFVQATTAPFPPRDKVKGDKGKEKEKEPRIYVHIGMGIHVDFGLEEVEDISVRRFQLLQGKAERVQEEIDGVVADIENVSWKTGFYIKL